jgi:KaiC/GvpD/RAD55 family RecA-like ATPase
MDDHKQPDLQIGISGMERILPPFGNINMYRGDDMVIAIHGAPGTGKTLLSMQMAYGIAAKNSKAILYLTKDTTPQSLMQKSIISFGCFDQMDFTDLPGIKDKGAWKKFVKSDSGLPGHLIETYLKVLKDVFEKALASKNAITNSADLRIPLKSPELNFPNLKNRKGEDLKIVSIITKLINNLGAEADETTVADERLSALFTIAKELCQETINCLRGNVLLNAGSTAEGTGKTEERKFNTEDARSILRVLFPAICCLKDFAVLKKSHCDFLLGNNLLGILKMQRRIALGEDKCVLKNEKDSSAGLIATSESGNSIAKKEESKPKPVMLENLASQYAEIEKLMSASSGVFSRCYDMLDPEFRLLLLEETGRRFEKDGNSRKCRNLVDLCSRRRCGDKGSGALFQINEYRDRNRYCELTQDEMGTLKNHAESIIRNFEKDYDSKPILHKLVFDICLASLLDARDGSCLAFANLNPGAFSGKPVNRYSDQYANSEMFSPITSITSLCPSLAPLFSWLRREQKKIERDEDSGEKHHGYGKKVNEIKVDSTIENTEFEEKLCGIRSFWNNQLMVVCDSVSPPMFEECLNVHHTWSQKTTSHDRGATDDMNFAMPTWLFIVESEELPSSATAAFAPDVQICMKAQPLSYNVCKRTIHIQKARHQAVENEPFPFLIVTAEDSESGQKNINLSDGSEYPKHHRVPGISILPSISNFIGKESLEIRDTSAIAFGKDIDDKLTKPIVNRDGKVLSEGTKNGKAGSFDGGNCTIVTSENRCNSAVFGLHFLIGSLSPQVQIEKTGSDTLYISLDNSLEQVLQTIHDFKKLIEVFTDIPNVKNIKKVTTEQDQANDQVMSGAKARHSGVFYKLDAIKSKSSLIVYTPRHEWKITEEVLDDICWAIEANKAPTWNISRVLFSRVSRVKSCWPLIDDPKILVSNIAQMCKNQGISFMVIDDTADQSSHTGHITSDYFSLASNILRLKRVSIRGTQSVALEVTRALNREINHRRPLELYTDRSGDDIGWDLKVRDTFRGYSSIYSDDPKHCKIRLDLPYDRERSPLQEQIEQIKYNLELLFDKEQVKVRSLGPSKLHGINAALAHLANLTHETCHISAVDEIWLSSLINPEPDVAAEYEPALAELRGDDLERILPTRLVDRYAGSVGKEKLNLAVATKLFVTKALTINQSLKTTPMPYPFAIPYYHNWGVFVVSQPQKDLFRKFYESIVEKVTRKGNRTSKGVCKKIFINKLPSSKNRTLVSIWELLWEAKTELTSWEILRDFKMKIWDKIFSKDNIAKIDIMLQNPKNSEYQRLFPNGFNLRFFTICSESQEAVVCFFLELILARAKQWELFDITAKTDDKSPFIFNKSSCDKFTDALILMFDLLCEEDRRKIALGKWNSDRADSKSKSDSPRGVDSITALFSREWITSIPQLQLSNDWREKIELTHLPKWDDSLACEDRLFDLIQDNITSPSPDESSAHETIKSKDLDNELNNLQLYNSVLEDIINMNNKLIVALSKEEVELKMVLRHCKDEKRKKLFENMNNRLIEVERNKEKKDDEENDMEIIAAIKSINKLGNGPPDQDIKKPDEILKIIRSIREDFLKDACKNKGPTVSGTWYLGVLRGGNIDLAADIIGELTTELREIDRVRNAKAAGVFKATYEDTIDSEPEEIRVNQYSKGNSGFSAFPYSNIIRLCHCGEIPSLENDEMYVYPFCRVRIKKYPEVSIELYDLIRQVMKLSYDMSEEKIKKEVEVLVAGALKRISIIQEGNTSLRASEA